MYKLFCIFHLAFFSFVLSSCTTVQKVSIEKKNIPGQAKIKNLAISINSHTYPELVQEYLEEELDIVQKVTILDEEDTNNTDIPLLKIHVRSNNSSPIWKFLGLGIIPTYQNQSFDIEAELIKDRKKVIGWSFNIEAKSYFSIWFLPFIHKYDPDHYKSLTLIINNIMSDLITEKIL